MKNLCLIFFSCACSVLSGQVKKGDTITLASAHLVTSFDSSDIESMVTYYFASRIRGDQKWKEVLPDSALWSERMLYSIRKHNAWHFTRFVNLGLQQAETITVVKVYFAIEFRGREDDGTDDVELRREGERWVVDVVPN